MTKILLLEDNAIQAASLAAMLADAGYEVTATAASGEQALQAARRRLPDLAILDIKVYGEMDGIEVGKTLTLMQPMPIIYLTAYAENYERAKITHPAAFFSKPYNERDLLHAIDLAVYTFSRQLPGGNSPAGEPPPEHASNLYFSTDCLWIKTKAGHPFHRVAVADIQWIAAANVYIDIHVAGRDTPFTLTMGISEFEQRAPYPSLVRTHRSYLINTRWTTRFDSHTVWLGPDRAIPISTSHRETVLAALRAGPLAV